MSECLHYSPLQIIPQNVVPVTLQIAFLIISGTRWSPSRRTSRTQLLLGGPRFVIQIFRSDFGWSSTQCYPSRSKDQLDLQGCHETSWNAWSYISRQEFTWRRKGIQIFTNDRWIPSCCLETQEPFAFTQKAIEGVPFSPECRRFIFILCTQCKCVSCGNKVHLKEKNLSFRSAVRCF